MRSRYLKLLAILLVVAGIVLFAFKPGAISLIDLPTPPRDAPVPDPSGRGLAFSALADELSESGPELRKTRNRIVEAWVEALDAYRVGRAPLRRAELIELKVLTARHQVGEIGRQELHAGRVLLIEREIERIRQLMALTPPQASGLILREAEVYLARERLLAGVAEHGYGALREAQLQALADRVRIIAKQDPRSLPAARDDLDDFKDQCPPEAELLARLAP